MHMLFLISLLIALLVFLLLNIIEHFLLGDRGRRKSLSNYYKQLRSVGEMEEQPNNERSRDVIKYTSIKDYYVYIAPSCIVLFPCALFAFKSMFMAVVLSLFGFLTPRILFEHNQKKIKESLTIQFRDALNSITSSLKAGLSLNSAFFQCEEDLRRLHGGKKEQYMLREFERINTDLHTGMSIDDALKELKERLYVDDVEDFVNSILAVRQKGGNLVEIVENVSRMITEKLSIRAEIKILTAGKKMEARMLTITPVAMIAILSILSPNYMQAMVNTVLGRLLMIVAFILLTANFFIGKKIVDIKV